MIVDELQTRADAERVSRSARLRWEGGAFRLWISGPAALIGERADASPKGGPQQDGARATARP